MNLPASFFHRKINTYNQQKKQDDKNREKEKMQFNECAVILFCKNQPPTYDGNASPEKTIGIYAFLCVCVCVSKYVLSLKMSKIQEIPSEIFLEIDNKKISR